MTFWALFIETLRILLLTVNQSRPEAPSQPSDFLIAQPATRTGFAACIIHLSLLVGPEDTTVSLHNRRASRQGKDLKLGMGNSSPRDITVAYRYFFWPFSWKTQLSPTSLRFPRHSPQWHLLWSVFSSISLAHNALFSWILELLTCSKAIET